MRELLRLFFLAEELDEYFETRSTISNDEVEDEGDFKRILPFGIFEQPSSPYY